MQFPVPQFLDVEDKIFGPFSLKQFGIIFVTGLLDVAFFRTLQLSLPFFIFAIPFTAIGAGLAFASFNGKRIYNQIPALLKYMSAPKVMVFHKTADLSKLDVHSITMDEYKQIVTKPDANKAGQEEEPQSKLKRLSRLLDQKAEEEEEIVKSR